MNSDRVSVAIGHTRLFPQEFRPDFPEWLQENSHIYVEFERRALQVAVHRRHYSARTIIEVLRHDSAIKQLSGDFKINGNYVPDMAYLFAQLNPQHCDLFEYRRDARAERLAA